MAGRTSGQESTSHRRGPVIEACRRWRRTRGDLHGRGRLRSLGRLGTTRHTDAPPGTAAAGRSASQGSSVRVGRRRRAGSGTTRRREGRIDGEGCADGDRLARGRPRTGGPDLPLGVDDAAGEAAGGCSDELPARAAGGRRLACSDRGRRGRRAVCCGAGHAATHRLDHHDVRGLAVGRVAGLGLAVRAAAATQRVGQRRGPEGHGSDGAAERQGRCDQRDAVRPAVTRSAPGAAHLGVPPVPDDGIDPRKRYAIWSHSAQLGRFLPCSTRRTRGPPTWLLRRRQDRLASRR